MNKEISVFMPLQNISCIHYAIAISQSEYAIFFEKATIDHYLPAMMADTVFT